jgi:hypothetical protein
MTATATAASGLNEERLIIRMNPTEANSISNDILAERPAS